MAITISSREDKSEQTDLLRRIIQRYLFPGVLNLGSREAILRHLDWISQQKQIVIQCELRTLPEIQTTKIEILITH